MKYTGENSLTMLITLIKSALSNKVEKVTGKGLSANDYTDTEKTKLAGLSNYSLPAASASTLGGVKIGAGLAVDGNGVVSTTGGGTADSVAWANVIGRPTAVSAFTNDVGYQTSSDVTTAINNALSGISGIEFEIVTELPATGDSGKFYLISNDGDSGNAYDEYIYYNSAWEKIGTTDVDLSGYLQSSDFIEYTNTEIQNLWNSVV